MMPDYYDLGRMAQAHRQELLRDAEHERLLAQLPQPDRRALLPSLARLMLSLLRKMAVDSVRDDIQHGLPCHHSHSHQARRACNSVSSGSRAVVERGGIEQQYVKSLSAWSPKYTPESLLREAATRLQDRILFGSDYRRHLRLRILLEVPT